MAAHQRRREHYSQIKVLRQSIWQTNVINLHFELYYQYVRLRNMMFWDYIRTHTHIYVLPI